MISNRHAITSKNQVYKGSPAQRLRLLKTTSDGASAAPLPNCALRNAGKKQILVQPVLRSEAQEEAKSVFLVNLS